MPGANNNRKMIIEARRGVVSLRGTLKESHWDAIAAAVDLVLPDHPQGILLDCSALTTMTEMGGATFMDGLSYMEARGARIILCSVPPAIQTVLRAVPGLHSQIPTAETVEQGRQSLLAGKAAPLTAKANAVIVLVPVNPPFSVEAVRQLLKRLHLAAGSEIHFVYVLLVPRALPVGAPLPEDEARAEQLLTRAEQEISNVKSERHVVRGRHMADAIVEAATKLGASEVIVGLDSSSSEDESVASILQGLRDKAPCSLTVTQEVGGRAKAEGV